MLLFRHLLDVLLPPRETERLARDATPQMLGALLAPTAVEDAAEPVVALFPYKEPVVAALIREAKYHGSQHAARLLGNSLAEYLASFVAEEDAYERHDFALLPIPLSRERRRERGYNQVECVVAYALAHLAIKGVPHTDTLVRVRDTTPQARLPRVERLTNMKGAFAAENVDPGLTYIVIDDVVTTGTTLAEAARALRVAGASRVLCVALAHQELRKRV